MSDLEIFKGSALVNSERYKSLLDSNKKMAGGGSAGKRLSIKGGKFRKFVDGAQVSVSRSDTMNMVILNAADVSRTYYAGSFDENNTAPPMCWSLDTRAPAPEVLEENRQAARCGDCPMNVKGSGQGETRACRFAQRLAISLEGELETVYQLQLPATSLFGDANGGDMGLQAYIKFLSGHDTPAVAVVTEMRFDDESATPKLYFKATRALDEDELTKVLEARDSEEALRAIEFTVGSQDKKPVEDKPKPKAKKVEEEVEELAHTEVPR